MARAQPLSTLRHRIAKGADFPDFTATSRHTIQDVNRFINDSWQDMRVRVSATTGGRMLYSKPLTGTLTAGATAPFSWGVLALPTDVAHVTGLEITLPNGRRRTMQHLSWDSRNDFYDRYGRLTGSPIGFIIYNVGVESGATVTAGSIGILPAPDLAYAYTLWYVPPWADVGIGADQPTFVFDGVEGWDDYVVQDCIIKIAQSDADMQKVYDIATKERGFALERILGSANTFQRVSAITREDTDERETLEYDAKWSELR